MDDRQTKIREGAGLEDSRVNQELLDFLQKWASPVLITLALIALAWSGWGYLQRKQVEKVDAAFAAYDTVVAGNNPSPASLRLVAEEYAGVRSVSELALLDTVDIYLNAALIGIEPGAELDPLTREPINEDDRLDEARTNTYLSQARDLSQQVVEATKDDSAKAILTIKGWMRLAAAQEGLGSFDAAKSSYRSAGAAADAAGLSALARLAEIRVDAVDGVAAAEGLPSSEDLAPLPGEEALEEPGLDSLIDIPSIESSLIEDDADPDAADDAAVEGDEAVDEPESDEPAATP